jgi:hypothetical protein
MAKLGKPGSTMPSGEPLMEIKDPMLGKVTCPVNWTEVARIMGLHEEDLQGLLEDHVCDP